MTDFFILAVAVFAAVVLVRLLTSGWEPVEEEEREEV
ncbi:hypothetical protein jaqu_01510 [Jannaschia aquimarina]|uniref:Uncharacterized protein n=1 Tax=Jannaschia aquimarina TaxID=935700 RepID=A0A0D1EM24_9RHOB|nr:hypothetical protein jaqu_01510 [Jannaschia aquimarina]SNS88805.1 hypothetical protein SAMN05421775_103176 [Jannaschia aquimarina]